ncbi:hypothetical protein [Bdellovibrio svalbardensis]|uniref:Lipoprotein n=1 Tax=Bdellovibrio svalbardensis TaxID=2972972 RepID=A0ABT6DGP6_9BACT|nr:hypothetical protein [Bdellovibrio svalbardensis]MDG0815679.1 hypothetical protein [Bdellovibrio svalbardensis]
MNFARAAQMIATLGALSLLAACSGGGFQSLSSVADNSGQSTGGTNDGQSTPTPAPTPSAYDKLDMEGYVSGGAYDSNFAVKLDKENDALIVNLPIPAGPFSNIYVDVPNLKGAKIKTYYDANNKPQVAISVPLKHVLRGVSTLPSSKLPNGNALPAMPSGEAPSLAFGLNANSENKVYLYIGVNAVGLYIENSYIPQYIGITLPIKNKAQTKILGYFTIVPKSGNFSGGLFTSFPLPNDIAKIIDDHLSGIIH